VPAPPPLPPLPPGLAARLAAVRAVNQRLHDHLAGLDPAQQAAVLADDPAALVRAQVGSGKTTVLVAKVLHLHLAEGVPLEEMAVLTFTNKAADEIRARIDDLGGRATAPAERWLMGTFHGVARSLLERALPLEQVGYRPGFAVLDEGERDALLGEVVRAHRLRLRRGRLRARLRALAADGAPAGAADDDLPRLAALARAEKRARNVMDFDDLIDHATALLGSTVAGRPPRWIIVDELQDCEPRELELLRRLRGAGTRFFGVGDPHQAIYGWRGSVPDLFARAEADFGCRCYRLPVNYRSTRTILDGASAVLGAQAAGGGELRGVRDRGSRIVVRRHHDPVGEAVYLAARIARLAAGGVSRREIAVLARLRAQTEALGRMLADQGTPCAAGADADLDAVRVLTLHAAKGLEFRHVFISGVNLGVVPLALRGTTADEAEERRLLFVGLTRARDDVEISYHASPHCFGAVGEPSPFLHRLPAPLVEWAEAQDPIAAPVAVAAPAALAAPVGAAAPVAAPTPAATTAPWHAGQAVRHHRYGAGVVVGVAADTVDCDFGKLGRRAFPLRLCPLVATPAETAPAAAAPAKAAP
jgi:superfamily I DNA/RNA helicase